MDCKCDPEEKPIVNSCPKDSIRRSKYIWFSSKIKAMKKEMKYGVITGMNDLWAWIAGN